MSSVGTFRVRAGDVLRSSVWNTFWESKKGRVRQHRITLDLPRSRSTEMMKIGAQIQTIANFMLDYANYSAWVGRLDSRNRAFRSFSSQNCNEGSETRKLSPRDELRFVAFVHGEKHRSIGTSFGTFCKSCYLVSRASPDGTEEFFLATASDLEYFQLHDKISKQGSAYLSEHMHHGREDEGTLRELEEKEAMEIQRFEAEQELAYFLILGALVVLAMIATISLG